MTKRNPCLWMLAMLLLFVTAGCEFGDGGSDDDSPSIVGSYERLTDNAMERQAQTTTIESTYYYSRIDALPDLSATPTCVLPDGFAIIGHYFTIHPDHSYTEQLLVDQDGQTCLLVEEGVLNVDNDSIVTDQGEEAGFEFRDDGQTLVLYARYEGVLYEENLLDTGNYDWLYGAWLRQDQPAETLDIDRETGEVGFTYLRHVTRPAGESPAIDAECGYVVSGSDPRLYPHNISNELTLEFRANDVSLLSEYQDVLDCAYYILDLDNTIMRDGLEYQFEVAQAGDNLVIDGAATYVRAR